VATTPCAFRVSCFCALRGPRGPTAIPCPRLDPHGIAGTHQHLSSTGVDWLVLNPESKHPQLNALAATGCSGLRWVAKEDNYCPMNILELTAAQLRRAAQLKEEIEAAQADLASILGGDVTGSRTPAPAVGVVVQTKKLHWTQTPEGKARMAKLIRASWRKRRS